MEYEKRRESDSVRFKRKRRGEEKLKGIERAGEREKAERRGDENSRNRLRG